MRLTPRAGTDRLDGIAAAVDGRPVLKISVKAPPAEGRANDALLRLLAREWRVAQRDLAIVIGATGRSKIVHIAGDPESLARRIEAALRTLPRS